MLSNIALFGGAVEQFSIFCNRFAVQFGCRKNQMHQAVNTPNIVCVVLGTTQNPVDYPL